jgi:indole-3-glycerol phosphate synthase
MILDDIAASTRIRVEKAKAARPAEAVRDAALTQTSLGLSPGQSSDDSDTAKPRLAFEHALAAPGLSFICEVKKASPSRGLIYEDKPGAPPFPYLEIAGDYEAAGASAISVLTEPTYFLGNDRYLREIAGVARVPILRKDFIIDAYQIYEAKLLGASAILLICALLDTKILCDYIRLADSLGLASLVETHSEDEVRSALDAGARVIGINNRDLKTFKVDLAVTGRLRKLIPPGILTVSESGIRGPEDVRALTADQGIDAVLIGEILMGAADKREYLRELQAAGNKK